MIRFYFKKGRWRVTSDKTIVNAAAWWNAINQVKCMNHKLRTARDGNHSSVTSAIEAGFIDRRLGPKCRLQSGQTHTEFILSAGPLIRSVLD